MIAEFREHVLDLLAPLGDVEAGRMFGGTGFKIDGIQFAMLMQDTLYFVANEKSRAKYIDAGSQPFSYEKQGRTQLVKRYYEVPADVLESPATFLEWAEEAVAASREKR